MAKVTIRIHTGRLRRFFGQNLGAPFVIGFQILLLVCLGLRIQGEPALANEVAIFGYWSLVIGVVLQLVCILGHRGSAID